MARVETLIDDLGGNAQVARALGLNASTISEMKRRGSIPPRYWPKFISLAEKQGLIDVSANWLMEAHAVPPLSSDDGEHAAPATSCHAETPAEIPHAEAAR